MCQSRSIGVRAGDSSGLAVLCEFFGHGLVVWLAFGALHAPLRRVVEATGGIDSKKAVLLAMGGADSFH
jgi:hypothetical protein